MKAKSLRAAVLSLALGSALAFHAIAAAPAPANPGWPRVSKRDGIQFVVYQPQIENWKDFQDLTWRMAVGVTPRGGKEVLGVLDMQGKTSVDFEAKSVVISDMEITGTHFQWENAEKMAELVKPLSQGSVTMSLHRLVSCAPKMESVPGVKLNNDPPQIFVGYSPSILLNVNGAPVLSEISETNLKYVANTHWAIFFDGTNYYMPVGQLWLTSGSLDGKWTPTRTVPAAMSMVVKEQRWSALKKMVPPPAKPAGPVPAVFYSDKPADIILFDGQPEYTPIPDTQLMYATNTDSVLFVYTPTGEVYYLTGGRWFGAKSLEGPWTFATQNLPADFKKIPTSSPASAILASVPGNRTGRGRGLTGAGANNGDRRSREGTGQGQSRVWR